jgi:hypothetical protein
VESKQAVPCPDILHWVSAAGVSGGKRAAARSQAREGSQEDSYICLTFLIFKCWNFNNNFYIAVFTGMFMDVLVLVEI